MVCEKCGNEAEMIIKEEELSAAEHDHTQGDKPKPKKTVMVCKECGNEANMILEEVEIDE
jgi:hypothetical protein